MVYYIAVFRSRTQTILFNQVLRSYGAECFVINTPRQAEVSCGLSVKFAGDDLGLARQILSRREFSSFVGIFKVHEGRNGFSQVVRI